MQCADWRLSEMSNTSATGGYLKPTNTVLDGNLLQDFFHGVIAGVTGLDNTLVVPAFQNQPGPPLRPDIDVDWCGFAIMNRRTEALPWYVQNDGNDGTLSRTELFDLQVSFYGPNCTGYAGMLRDGLQITQNLEQLFAAGMAPEGTQDIVYLPEFINGRYYQRADLTVNMNRDVSRTYAILSLLSAQGTLQFESGYEENFEVTT